MSARRKTVLALLALLAGMLIGLGGHPTPASAAPACEVKQSGAAAQANTAVAKACGLIGTPYAWAGGHGPNPGISWGVCDASNGAPNDCHVRGLDCSGMVRYAYYLAVGADVINGPTWVQFASSRAVGRWYRSAGLAPLLPGDLVFYGNAETIHHVAMYIGQGYMVESPNSGSYVRVNSVYAYGDYYGAIRLYNPDGSSPPPPAPPADPDKSWVDTFANAPVYDSPTSTTETGTLNQGTNYVYCKVWGRQVGSGASFNHWWLKTDPDVGPAEQWVSAYYLSRWGNDEAKDNGGAVIRDCGNPPAPPPTAGKFWVDTFSNASGYASPSSTTATGTLYQGTNYVYCKQWGRQVGSGSSFNHWWLRTDLDVGPADQWVSAYYLSRWGNDEAKDNSGAVIADCAGSSTPPASTYWVDTFANAAVYASPTGTSPTGTLYGATNYVYCKAWGREVRDSGGSFNHWWLKTDPDEGPAQQWVSAYYLSRWGNDEAKDNNGTVIATC